MFIFLVTIGRKLCHFVKQHLERNFEKLTVYFFPTDNLAVFNNNNLYYKHPIKFISDSENI